jgi:hypothetical protein
MSIRGSFDLGGARDAPACRESWKSDSVTEVGRVNDVIEVSKRVAARQQRLAAFPGQGTPPGGVVCELLCEDHVGTYALPYLCNERRVAQHWNR